MANNDISGITMNTDWGAPGARLTGRQVQRFIKKRLTELDTKLGTNDDDIEDLKGRMEAAEETLEPTASKANQHHTAIARLQTESQQLELRVDAELNPLLDSCVLIAYHSEEEGATSGTHSPHCRFATYQQWKRWNEEGENPYTADGVAVFDHNGQPLIIAVTEVANTNSWDGSLSGTPHKITTAVRESFSTSLSLIQYHGGLGDTDLIAASSELGLAAQCRNYSRQYTVMVDDTDYDGGFGSGNDPGEVSHWWMPSSGECYLMMRHREMINLCLSVIRNSRQIDEDAYYYTSTELTATQVVAVDFAQRRFHLTGKRQFGHGRYTTRPVIRPQLGWDTDSMGVTTD